MVSKTSNRVYPLTWRAIPLFLRGYSPYSLFLGGGGGHSLLIFLQYQSIKFFPKGDVRVSFPPFSWGNGWNYFVVFNSSHSSMGCLANQRRLCPSWKWREPEPEPIEEWLELFCWLLGIAVNNLIPAIPSWKWRETDSNIPLINTFAENDDAENILT